MAYIHDKNEEKTGYQSDRKLQGEIDFQNDFAMAYVSPDNMESFVEGFRKRGYVTHLMTGLAWGHYKDYLDGDWDGIDHWEDSQKNPTGQIYFHGGGVPYMVPTVSFGHYLIERLKKAVDVGIEAIFLEEPEFWSGEGYSESFQREFETVYQRPWKPYEENPADCYDACKLMAQMYFRSVERIGEALKNYAKFKYGKNLRIYVATHSLINYTQWGIMSPEALFTASPYIDGYIAQIWTGTSRPANRYKGVVTERTFETAFLEYGIMQELVRGTDKKMWFLHDPVEDDPNHDWDDFRFNYRKTVAASLFHPAVDCYEICPWPDRVVNGVYPIVDGKPAKNALPISEEYRTVLCNTFNMLGDMEKVKAGFEGVNFNIGVLLANSMLYQRRMPKKVRESSEILQQASTSTMCDFYGLALPLVKKGLPLRPVQLDNVRNVAGYLDDYQVLVLSYDFMKPETPDINLSLALWVLSGGALVYVGDGNDCYNEIPLWWNGKYNNPAEHLFECMNLPLNPEEGVYKVGKGAVSILKKRPAVLAHSEEGAEAMYNAANIALRQIGYEFTPKNYLLMHRGNYVISACLSESISDEPLILKGRYIDMTDAKLEFCKEVKVSIGEERILFDLDTIKSDELRIIGTSLRPISMEEKCDGFKLNVKGASQLNAEICLHTPKEVKAINAYCNGEAISSVWSFDNENSLARISLKSEGSEIEIIGLW